jgi:hypothetical protein
VGALFGVARVVNRLLGARKAEGLGEDLGVVADAGRSRYSVKGVFVAFGLRVIRNCVEFLVFPFGVLRGGFFLTAHGKDRGIGRGDHRHEVVEFFTITDSRRGKHGVGYNGHDGYPFLDAR